MELPNIQIPWKAILLETTKNLLKTFIPLSPDSGNPFREVKLNGENISGTMQFNRVFVDCFLKGTLALQE